jgi:hypothetical protein
MAHLVETMAFVGQTPWHGLGNQLTPNQPLKSGHNKQVWIGVLNLLTLVIWLRMKKVRVLLCL